MKRFSKRSKKLFVVFFAFLAMPFESTALELTITEKVGATEDSVGLWIGSFGTLLNSFTEVVSPSGDMYDASSRLDTQVTNQLLINFDSLSEAAAYLDGTWRGTVSPFFSTEPAMEFEFAIDGNFLEQIDRTPPMLLAPSPTETFKNGTAIDLSWDYPGAEKAINASTLQIVPDQTNSSSLAIVHDPSIRPTNSGGGSGSDSERFEHRISNVPGAVDNRFELVLLASEELLPLDVELTLGSHLVLTDSLNVPLEASFFSRLSYSRQNEPFTITLTPGTCDLDGDGECDFFDLDALLYAGISNGEAKYDLDGSGTVDLEDRNAFLEQSGRVPGDFNDDGGVDSSDLSILGDNWLQTGQTSYSHGDSNGDGILDALDLNVVGENWQASIAAANAPVPEPGGFTLIWAALLGLLAKRNAIHSRSFIR